MAVRMDWHEGFHVYGEHGSVVARRFQPWYLRAERGRVLLGRATASTTGRSARTAHFFRRQVEGFADTILDGAPQAGADVDDGLAAMRVIDAIERSVETATRVDAWPAS